MTVFRREDVQSRDASWDGRPYRTSSSPILTIVPLIIRRLRGPSLNRITIPSPMFPVVRVSLLHRDRGRLERGPQKTRELACDGHRNLGRGFVLFRQPSESTAQSLLGLVRDRNHPGRLVLPSFRERHADVCAVLIVPRRFHQQPPDQRVARARDTATSMFLAARVFTRHETEIRHQRARRLEPPKVMQLGQDQDRGQRVDPSEAPQPADRLAIRRRLRDLGEPSVELDEARLQVIDRQQIVVDDHALRGVRPVQTVDPLAMGLRPIAPAKVQAAAQQQLAQAMTSALQIFTGIITGPTEIADGFVFRGRRPDFRQQPPRGAARPICAHHDDSS